MLFKKRQISGEYYVSRLKSVGSCKGVCMYDGMCGVLRTVYHLKCGYLIYVYGGETLLISNKCNFVYYAPKTKDQETQ